MCTVCGCGEGETTMEGPAHAHEHRHADGSVHSHPHAHRGEHAHDHAHAHAPTTWHRHEPAAGPVHTHADGTTHRHADDPAGDAHNDLHYGRGPAGAHAPGLSQARMLQIEQNILSKNNSYAGDNRRRFTEHGIFAVNLVSSPGSGKTTLLVKTIETLQGRLPLAVVEGDQQTSVDAERIRATGARALQVNTGKGCHLDAHMVGQAVDRLGLPDDALLLIENVGNLVCPADFDLGEAHKVVILSVTEGEDKPLKYPNMFAAADLMLLNKVDLLPHLAFDVAKCIEHARRVNPRIRVIEVSATAGTGMDAWLAWLERGCAAARDGRAVTVEQLRRRIAELEAQLAARPV